MLRYIPDEWVGKKVIVTQSDGTFIIGQLISVWEIPTLNPKDEALVVEDFTGEVYYVTDDQSKVDLYTDEIARKLDEDKSNFAKHFNKLKEN